MPLHDDQNAFRAGLGAAFLALIFLGILGTLVRRAASMAYQEGREDAYARGWMTGFAYGREEAERETAPAPVDKED
jgi:hypothetical protein